MGKFLSKLSALSMLAMSLFMWSCDDLGQVTAPEIDPRGNAVFSSTTGERFVVVRESEGLGVVSGTIGAAGGKLLLGKHSLTVPAGAVSGPTVFSMGRADGDLVRLRLSASRDSYNDVGAAGFAAPLELRINFAGSEDVPADAGALQVVYFRPDGLIESQSTTVDSQGKIATGKIWHFSDFGLAWPMRTSTYTTYR